MYIIERSNGIKWFGVGVTIGSGLYLLSVLIINNNFTKFFPEDIVMGNHIIDEIFSFSVCKFAINGSISLAIGILLFVIGFTINLRKQNAS